MTALFESLGENPIIVGCNYHTSWQEDRGMRFVLKEIKGSRARLITRRTGRNFWTNTSDLVFITSVHNKIKALKLTQKP